ncbi:hypothetical protein [Agrococcus beijingensis]|uniref:hypothetical protein n=1 Tax=Agrococcus beijingensis TaxID=3068634 RepID=UPI0027410A55|nr:hypothetical protein [Agrococcus sp. REN33]
MNHASQPEGARPVHPDGEIDEPGSDAQTGAQYGGTTGAEHDGGREHMAAEMAEATDESIEGRSPRGAGAPVDGDVDAIHGAGSPTEGTGAGATFDGSPVREAASPAEGLGGPTPGTGTPVQAESPGAGAGAGAVQDAASPVQGLGPSPDGEGAPVQDADSPAHGTGAAVTEPAGVDIDETRRTDPLGSENRNLGTDAMEGDRLGLGDDGTDRRD